jgi:hypothetical protein
MPKSPFPGVDTNGYFDPTGQKLQVVADATALTALGTTLGTGDAGFQAYQADTFAIKTWTGSAWRSTATT